jgi:hypothetical protein
VWFIVMPVDVDYKQISGARQSADRLHAFTPD